MIAKIEIDVDDIRRIIDSLHEPINTPEDRSIDISLIVSENDSLKLFVNSTNNIQIEHIISDSEEISVETTTSYRFVFTSKVLRDILGKARSERIQIKFFENKYSVRLDTEDAFSTPTSLDLNLVSSTEFRDPVDYSSLKKIATLDRAALLESVQAMNIVSNVLQLKIVNDELWISVSDIVEGEGKFMKPTDPDCDFGDIELKYSIGPVVSFLENITPSQVDLLLNSDGVLEIESEQSGVVSKMYLAHRI